MTPKEKVEKFLSDTMDARIESERCRDYYDHKQWTTKEIAALAARNQAPIVVNRIRPKIKGLVGLYNLRKSDPKAYPRTQKHEDSAHAVTDALRYVSDNNDFDSTRLTLAEDFFIEGYTGTITDVKQKKKEIEIRIEQIPWDRIIFDPRSRKRDFSDARYMGLFMWMDIDELKTQFPNADVNRIKGMAVPTDDTTEDRPRWVEKKENRARVVQLFHLEGNKWKMTIFIEDYELVKTQDSPYLDDEGTPTNPIELASANVDRDNNRYGEVKGFLPQQDEINHRRSKGLHNFSTRQTFSRKGANADVATIKKELKKPDGHLEFEGDEWGKDFGIIPNGDMGRAQFDLYQDAKNEMDSVSFNAQLAGERQQGDLSGVAIDKLQQAGTIELNHEYNILMGLEKRTYRQVWARVKQFWNEEKWIRVTDDQDNLRWVGLNSQIKTQQWLEEKINDESGDLLERQKLAATFTFLMSAAENPETAEQAKAKLDQVIEIKNDTSELDVDIIIDQSFDVINVQQEQFNMISKFAQSGDIDIIELIELSQIRGKEDLIDKIEKRRAQQAEQLGNVAAKEAQSIDVNNAKKLEETKAVAAKTEQTRVETQILLNSPIDENPQITT